MLPDSGNVRNIPDHLPKSKMVRLSIEFWATEDGESLREDSEDFPAALFNYMAPFCVEEKHGVFEDREPINRPECFYHEHKTTKLCGESDSK
jgi:hypothetical protein